MSLASPVGLALVAKPLIPVAERVSVSSAFRIGASLADARPISTPYAPIRLIRGHRSIFVFLVCFVGHLLLPHPCFSASIRG